MLLKFFDETTHKDVQNALQGILTHSMGTSCSIETDPVVENHLDRRAVASPLAARTRRTEDIPDQDQDLMHRPNPHHRVHISDKRFRADLVVTSFLSSDTDIKLLIDVTGTHPTTSHNHPFILQQSRRRRRTSPEKKAHCLQQTLHIPAQ